MKNFDLVLYGSFSQSKCIGKNIYISSQLDLKQKCYYDILRLGKEREKKKKLLIKENSNIIIAYYSNGAKFKGELNVNIYLFK